MTPAGSHANLGTNRPSGNVNRSTIRQPSNRPNAAVAAPVNAGRCETSASMLGAFAAPNTMTNRAVNHAMGSRGRRQTIIPATAKQSTAKAMRTTLQ
jgi:hypothetical protein